MKKIFVVLMVAVLALAVFTPSAQAGGSGKFWTGAAVGVVTGLVVSEILHHPRPRPYHSGYGYGSPYGSGYPYNGSMYGQGSGLGAAQFCSTVPRSDMP